MVIIDYKTGQLANRIFKFSYFIANAIEYDYKIVNPCFDEYCYLFDATQTNKFGKKNISIRYSNIKFINKIIRRFLTVFKKKAKNNHGRFLFF